MQDSGNFSNIATVAEDGVSAKPPALRQTILFPEHDPRWLALINRVIEADFVEDGESVNGSLFQGELFDQESR